LWTSSLLKIKAISSLYADCTVTTPFAAAWVIGGGYEGGRVSVLSPVPPVSGYDAGRRHHVHHRRVRGRPHHHVRVTKDNGNILLKINTLPGCFCNQGQQQQSTEIKQITTMFVYPRTTTTFFYWVQHYSTESQHKWCQLI